MEGCAYRCCAYRFRANPNYLLSEWPASTGLPATYLGLPASYVGLLTDVIRGAALPLYKCAEITF